ncbi:P pilus assembly protein, pilin FimA [Escherichia coli]|uniref:fimbrial protein n=1 Tax=Escherichia coli TaxID=562 RepID=UPI0012FFA042|nr:fimbrial protein [Escherichia coli]CAD5644457.1 P pilus assembly protein, pilin FimA [Escherichia coli]CAD5881775.1 P pilus assembly protein, pilin FimA [Escherichia coli]CAD6120966.1 P pilus assembly protein, pilin FimA [Escherichia coli]
MNIKTTFTMIVFLFSGKVFSEQVEIKTFNLGVHSFTPQHSNSTVTPVYSQREMLPIDCSEKCDHVRISWIPLVPLLKPSRIDNGYIFNAGISGVSVLFKPEMMVNRALSQQLEIGLMKTSDKPDVGVIKTVPLIRRVTEQIDTSGQVIKTFYDDISITGQVNRSGCLMPQGQYLNIVLPPVSLSQLKVTTRYSPVGNIKETSYLYVQCEKNSNSTIDLFFTGKQGGGESVLPALTLSGKPSGVGFIVMSGDKRAIWDGVTPMNISLTDEEAQLAIPLTAFYTKIDDHPVPGKIESHGLITVKYH